MAYNQHYQQENFFGDTCPEVLAFFAALEPKGKLLDLGCGQGRDAIPLARMGFEVRGMDSSQVGIEYINRIAQTENLNLMAEVGDFYAFDDWDWVDCILMDSMFHFAKADKAKETAFLRRLFEVLRPGVWVVICMQAGKQKVAVLRDLLENAGLAERAKEIDYHYTFIDQSSGHASVSPYKLFAVRA